MPMDPGNLDRRITIQAPTRSRNSLGEEVQSWSDTAEVWAEVKPLTGRELFQAQQVVEQATHQVTIRYRAGITSDMRVVRDGGGILNIAFAQEINRREYLQLLCTEQR